MAFVNFTLIFGGLFAAIPIVLHLAMRRQPKHLVFPALRFIKQRRDANRRKLQLRHWLLLLLRCLALALLALALARPSVHSLLVGNWIMIGMLAAALLLVGTLAALAAIQRRGRALVGSLAGVTAVVLLALVGMWWSTTSHDQATAIGHSDAPVAAVLVFDTSPRMQYQRQNRSRLAEARQIAMWLTTQLPAGSELAVVDSRSPGAVFAVDIAAARSAIERLDTTGVPRPLPEVLDSAVQLALSSDQPRREVYVFTDRTKAAWTGQSMTPVADRLAARRDLLLYVVDVGVDDPTNFAIGDLRLSADSLPLGGTLRIETDLTRAGPAAAANAGLYLEDPDLTRPVIRDGKTEVPAARLRDQHTVQIAADGGATVEFRVSGLPAGTHQGFVAIEGADPLPPDDRRYFAIEVQDAWPVLVLAPDNAVTKYFVEAISPYQFRETGQTRFECTVEQQTALPSLELGGFAAVCLLDPAPLTPPDWQQLSRYVADGGGLAIFLGHNADLSSFNDPAATPLVGGRLARVWRSPGDVYLAPRTFSHPITQPFRDVATTVPWNQLPVYRHWVLEDFVEDARLILPFSNNQPALLETQVGGGRVLTMTTPVSDPLHRRGRPAWNELPTSEAAWPYVVIVNEMMKYLVDAAGTRLNYLAGETAVLNNSSERHPSRYKLFTPLEQPQEVTAADGRLVVRFTELPGAYRLKGIRGGVIVRGFAVNLPPEASDLERLPREQLDELLGGGERYRYARNQDEIVMGVGEARMGREFFPFLIALVALVLGIEQVFANRFYRAPE